MTTTTPENTVRVKRTYAPRKKKETVAEGLLAEVINDNNAEEITREWADEVNVLDGVSEAPSTEAPCTEPRTINTQRFNLRKSKERTVINEYIPRDRALWLYRHLEVNPHLLSKTSEAHAESTKRMGSIHHDSVTYSKLVMKMLRDIINSVSDHHPVEYSPNKSHGYGRRYSNRKDAVQVQGLARVFRHTLMKGTCVDIDVVNCFPEIIIQLGEKMNVSFDILNSYCSDRKSIFDSAFKQSGASKDTIKTAFLKVIFGGGALTGFGMITDVVLKSLKEEVSKGYSAILAKGDEGINTIREIIKKKKKEAEWPNIEGGTISLFCQCIEDACLTEWINVFGIEFVIALCFDGLMIQNDIVTIELLKEAEEKAYKSTGFRLRLEVKPMDGGIDIPEDELEACRLEIENAPLGSKIINYDDSEENIIAIRGHSNINRNEIFVWDGINSTFLQAVNAFVHNMYDRRLILPVSATDFSEVFCRKEGDNLWVNDKNHFRYIISMNGHKVVQEIISKKTGEKTGVAIPAGDNVTINNISTMSLTCAVGLQRDSRSALDIITDENIGKVFYVGSYYDLAKRRLIPYSEDQTATTFVRVEKKFCSKELWDSFSEESEDVKTIRSVFLGMLGLAKEQQDHALTIIAMAIGGEFVKAWYLCVSQRNGGKSLLVFLLTLIFGSYVTTFSAPVVSAQVSDSGAGNREIITRFLWIARLAFSNESKKDRKSRSANGSNRPEIDGDFVKNASSGGDGVIARNHNKGEESLRVTAKLFLNMNDVPIVTPTDALETAYLIDFPHKYEEASKYKSGLRSVMVKDPSILDKFKASDKLQWALTWLIFSFWDKSSVSGVLQREKAPSRVNMLYQSKFGDQLEATGDLVTIFGRLFEVGDIDKDFISCDDVYSKFFEFENAGGFEKRGKQDDMRYCCLLDSQGTDVFVKKRKMIDGRRQVLWYGIKPKIVRDLGDFEEDED